MLKNLRKKAKNVTFENVIQVFGSSISEEVEKSFGNRKNFLLIEIRSICSRECIIQLEKKSKPDYIRDISFNSYGWYAFMEKDISKVSLTDALGILTAKKQKRGKEWSIILEVSVESDISHHLEKLFQKI